MARCRNLEGCIDAFSLADLIGAFCLRRKGNEVGRGIKRGIGDGGHCTDPTEACTLQISLHHRAYALMDSGIEAIPEAAGGGEGASLA